MLFLPEVCHLARRSEPMIEWPDGKHFAFTIVDDTDGATVENVSPVYDVLLEHGLLTTKTVWPLGCTNGKDTPAQASGSSLEDPAYRAWILELAEKGFEIAFHGARDQSSLRDETARALDYFKDVLAHDPRMFVNHWGQKEGMYWGRSRLDGVPRIIYRLVNAAILRESRYYGHEEGSPHFWGDICRDRITYARNFVFRDINTLKKDPIMPYHDPRRPYVRWWYSASDAGTYEDFCDLLAEEHQDRLVAERGACIVYTHFALGFARDGRPRRRFVELIERLAGLPGWFVPASTLLDFLRERPGWQPEADRKTLGRMQREWLFGRLLHGRS